MSSHSYADYCEKISSLSRLFPAGTPVDFETLARCPTCHLPLLKDQDLTGTSGLLSDLKSDLEGDSRTWHPAQASSKSDLKLDPGEPLLNATVSDAEESESVNAVVSKLSTSGKAQSELTQPQTPEQRTRHRLSGDKGASSSDRSSKRKVSSVISNLLSSKTGSSKDESNPTRSKRRRTSVFEEGLLPLSVYQPKKVNVRKSYLFSCFRQNSPTNSSD